MRGILSSATRPTVSPRTTPSRSLSATGSRFRAQQNKKTLATELRLTRIDDVGDGSSSYTASGQYGAGQCFRDNITC